MTIQHKNIPDVDLHEPKGVSSAILNTVYVADGAGTGTWQGYPLRYYAELIIDSGVTTQALAAASAFSKLNPGTEWTVNLFNGLTTDPPQGEITLTSSGIYLLQFWVVFDTAAIAAASNYRFKYAINGTPSDRILETTKTTANVERLHLALQGLVSISANDVLSIYVSGDGTSSSTNITVREAGLTALKISG